MQVFQARSNKRLKVFPKIDLHRHLLGSARPQTLWGLARTYGLDEGRLSFYEFEAKLVRRKPAHDLAEYISPWKFYRNAIRRLEDVYRIASESAADAASDGLQYVEFRSSLPGMPVTDGTAPQTKIPPSDYLETLAEAFANASGIICRLVVSIPRHVLGPASPRAKTEYSKKFFQILENFRGRLIVGVDLTGIEKGWPCVQFKDFFSEVHKAGLPATIHSGETEGADEIWSAIDELGARRIGHGTSATTDQKLVDELIKQKIILEVCPSAGWLSGRLKSRYHHPIIEDPRPIPYVICTDNPALNGRTQSDEIRLAARMSGEPAESVISSQWDIAIRAAFSSIEKSYALVPSA